jgi:hypothetical protein
VPSAVVHGVVPLLFLLALRRVDARKIWALWPLTFAPDLDYFVGLHRAALTNVFVLLPIVAAWAYARRSGRRELQEWTLVAFAYLASHLVMDTFTGGTVPLYPLSDYTVCYYAGIVIHTTDNSFALEAGPCSHAGIPQVSEFYPWLSDADTAMLAFLLPAGLLVGAWNLRRYLKERRANAPPQ